MRHGDQQGATRLYLWVVLGAWALVSPACDSPEREPAPLESAGPSEPAPVLERPASEALPSIDAQKAVAAGPLPPEFGCRGVSRHHLGTGLGAARLVSDARGLWVVSYAHRDGERQLERFVFEPNADDARALSALSLGAAAAEAPRVPPAVSVAQGSLWVAATDAKGALKVVRSADTEQPQMRDVAGGLDARFAPALRAFDASRAVVAWVQGDATGMRVVSALIDGEDAKLMPITPPGHGATAPRFVVGGSAHTLIMLDAHAGVSPLLAVTFDAAGEPGAAQVWRPISQPYAPPSLVGVQLAGRPVQVAYTAIGNAATAAVGIVDVDKPEPPRALLRGSGYALLAVDATLGPSRAVFAMDAPIGQEPAPSLQVHVRVWDGARAGEPWVASAQRGSAQRPAIAYDAQRGLFAVAYVEGDTLVVQWLRCDA